MDDRAKTKITEFANTVVAFLPLHEGSIHIEHNSHKNDYITVQQAVDREEHGYTEDCWVSPEEKEKSIATDEHWLVQWYPISPVGFHIVSASSLAAILMWFYERMEIERDANDNE